MSVKIFNEKPEYIAELVVDRKRFTSTSKKYVVNDSFHSLLKNSLMIKYLYEVKSDHVYV
jgi:hypothetical protein